MSRKISILEGDTEPLDLKIGATKLVNGRPKRIKNLVDVAGVRAYFRKVDSQTNHIDGAACELLTGLYVRLDPVGAKNGGGDAFGAGSRGTYIGHVKVTWADGDVTRHPDDPNEYLVVSVGAALG